MVAEPLLVSQEGLSALVYAVRQDSAGSVWDRMTVMNIWISQV